MANYTCYHFLYGALVSSCSNSFKDGLQGAQRIGSIASDKKG